MSLAHGCAIGWVSPFLPYLRSEGTHLVTGPVESADVSWIGSSLCIGGFFGTILFGKLSQKFGKKTSLLLLVFPHFGFWIAILLSTHIYHLYMARILAGFAGGGTLRTVSLFITEISENRIRGRLGSHFILFLCSGTLLAFIAGTFFSFFVVPWLMMILPTVFFVSVLFLRDTPPSLMARNKPDEAWESLKFYRTCGKNQTAIESITEEFQLLRKTLDNRDYVKLELNDFCKFSCLIEVEFVFKLVFFQ